MSWWFYVFIFGTTLFHAVYAAHNQTVDDTSTSIQYVGTWLSTTAQPTRLGGTTHYTKVQGSYASFTFTGATKIYYMGYGIVAGIVTDPTMHVTFDGTVYGVDETRQANEVDQAIMWSSGTLDPSVTHTIICTKTSASGGGMDMNVDAFILTIPDAGDTTSATLRRTPLVAPTTTTFQSTQSQSSQTTQISQSTDSATSSQTLSSVPIWTPSGSGFVSTTSVDAAVSNPSSVSSYSSQQSTDSHDIAAVVGGTLGGLALGAAIAALLFYFIRNGRKTSKSRGIVPFVQDNDRSELNLLPPGAGIREKAPSLRTAASPQVPTATVISDEASTAPTQGIWLDSAPPPAYTPRHHPVA